MTQRKALFLDRDGVINIDHGYVHSVDQFDFVEGVFDLVRSARRAGFVVLVITNQSGIGRGLYTEDDFHGLTNWMCQEFARQRAPIDKVYFSPFHPTHGIGRYRQDENTRKPRPGMILSAKSDFNLSLTRSILIGDMPSDIRAGNDAGVGKNFLLGDRNQCDPINVPHIKIDKLSDVLVFFEGDD